MALSSTERGRRLRAKRRAEREARKSVQVAQFSDADKTAQVGPFYNADDAQPAVAILSREWFALMAADERLAKPRRIIPPAPPSEPPQRKEGPQDGGGYEPFWRPIARLAAEAACLLSRKIFDW